MPTYQIVLFSAAITVVFTQGEIFAFLRRGPWLWRELVKCALCSGVWVGGAMHALFSGFPHVGDDLLTILSSVARLLGTACSSGCVAVLFVALWEKLDEPAKAAIDVRAENLTVPHAQITAPSIKLITPGYEDEAPTDPSTSDSRKTKRVPVDELRVEASRRSLPDK